MKTIELLSPADQEEISFLTQAQKDFLTDPKRFTPHDPELEPQKIDLSIPARALFRWNGPEDAQVLICEDPGFSNPKVYSGKIIRQKFPIFFPENNTIGG